MIHIGKNTKSTIVSKGISAGHGQNTYRGLVKILGKADNARNYSQCDSLLIGDKCGAHTFPYIEVNNSTAQMEHEASTSKIGEDQIFYFQQRGISAEDAVSMIVNGFCKQVFKELPMEFAVEAQKLARESASKDRSDDEGLETGRDISRPNDAARTSMTNRPLLQIENLHASVGGKPILRGVDLTVECRRGPRDHGAQRLRQVDARPRARGPARLRGHGRAACSSRARTSSRWRPRSGRARASSSRSSIPSRFPASRTSTS